MARRPMAPENYDLGRDTMRVFWVFGCVVALAGCAAPPAFTIATLAADGFSYLATGKGIGDHVLSAAIQQDCAVWNMVKAQDFSAVCHDYDGTEGITVVAAVSPKSPVDDRRYFAANSYRSATPTLRPAAIDAAPVSAIPALATAPANHADENHRAANDRVANHRAANHRAANHRAANHKGAYLVVGSFRRLDNAKRYFAGISASTIGVTTAVVDGEVVHRVVAGPFDGKDMAAARSRAVAAGVAKPWTIDLCTADLATPPCRAPTVLAKRTAPLNLAANAATPAGPAN